MPQKRPTVRSQDPDLIEFWMRPGKGVTEPGRNCTERRKMQLEKLIYLF
jgi:hypothetical protein